MGEVQKFSKILFHIWILILLFPRNRAEEFEMPSSDLIKMFNNIDCIEASALLENQQTLTENYDLYEKLPLNLSNINKNSKSLLTTIHELAQYNKITYNYVLVSEEGPPHSKLYRVILNIGDEQYEGEGGSLKKAQNTAAKQAVGQTSYTIPPEQIGINQQKQTPTVILNNIATKLGIKVTYHIDEKNLISVDSKSNKIKMNYLKKLNLSAFDEELPIEDPQIIGPFFVKLLFDNREFSGYGQTIQAARHSAAMKALDFIKKQADYQNHICNLDESDADCRQKRETLKSPISRLYELAQQHQFVIEFKVIEEHGKDHRKKFVTQCRIDDEFVTIGEGNTKKVSKRIAAENMLEELSNFINLQSINEKQIVNTFKPAEKQKKKKKTKKLIKNSENIFKSTTDVILTTILTNDEDAAKKPKFTPKQKLLEISNLLKFDIKFNNLGRNGDNYYSILFLGIRPPYVCLGEATTEDGSTKNAAINGLKFLKTEIFDNLPKDNKFDSTEIDLIIDNDQLPDYTEHS